MPYVKPAGVSLSEFREMPKGWYMQQLGKKPAQIIPGKAFVQSLLQKWRSYSPLRKRELREKYTNASRHSDKKRGGDDAAPSASQPTQATQASQASQSSQSSSHPKTPPPGWVMERKDYGPTKAHPKGRSVMTLHGPKGAKARSIREAWRLHAQRGF
jgi:hypothetical protein